MQFCAAPTVRSTRRPAECTTQPEIGEQVWRVLRRRTAELVERDLQHWRQWRFGRTQARIEHPVDRAPRMHERRAVHPVRTLLGKSIGWSPVERSMAAAHVATHERITIRIVASHGEVAANRTHC